tara:strand:- start:630 stop:962 length:333 start_codon:yes stop_codon:yes gene_type:complete
MFEPKLVYKSPGDQYGPEGKTYSWAGVKTQEELDGKLADGWFATLAEAIAPKDAPKIEPKAVEPDENAPPTRSELEQKAEELGLKFDGRTSDNKLSQKIQESLGTLNGLD